MQEEGRGGGGKSSGFFGPIVEDWKSLSSTAKVVVIISLLAMVVVLSLAFYETEGRVISPLIFYAVIAAVAALTVAPAYRMAKRPKVELPPQAPPTPKPKPLTAEGMLPKEEGEKGISRLSLLLARPVSPRARVYVIAGSAVMTLVLVLGATFVYPTYLARPSYDNFMIGILIVGLMAPSFIDLVDRRYKSLIDAKIPDFLREIGESQRTGTPFTRALIQASKSNYGPLSAELSKAMAKMSWGMTFEEALDAFSAAVDTALAYRAAVLLKEVGRSGGQMLEVLDQVYGHVREVVGLKMERAKQLTPYVAVVYAAFGVYLFVVYILFSTFFAQVSNLQASGSPFGSNIPTSTYYIWFFHMAVIEGLFGGMVIGKISAGSSVAGTKHVLVLLAISLIFFTFFIKY